MFGKKRAPGWGSVRIRPCLFHDEKDAIKEIKKKIAPFLNEEEENQLLYSLKNFNSVAIFVPRDIYDSVRSGTLQLKTVDVEAFHENVENWCCWRYWMGCASCGAPAVPKGIRDELNSQLLAEAAVSGDDEALGGTLTNYHIRGI